MTIFDVANRSLRYFDSTKPGRPPDAFIDGVVRVAARFWPLVVIALGLLYFLPGLGNQAFGTEEGRRALMARSMIEHGAWWHLEVLGRAYVNKPPLLPWMIAFFAALTGSIDEVSVRLPGVLFAICGALGAGVLAGRMADAHQRPFAALLAALCFLLTGYIQLKTRIAETDVGSIALVGLSFMSWAFIRLAPARARLWWLSSLLCFVLAGLIRGPIPLLFAAIPMLATEIWDGSKRSLAATILLFVIGLSPCAIWAFSNLDAGSANFTKYAAEMRLVVQPGSSGLAYHLHLGRIPQALPQLLPWLVFAVAFALKRAGPTSPDRRWLVRALLLYVGPLSVIVLLWPGSRERYAMPIVWPIAVLSGIALSELWARRRSVGRILAGMTVAWLTFQLIVAFAVDGNKARDREVRSEASALRAIVSNLAPGDVEVFSWDEDSEFAVLAYLPQSLPLRGMEALDGPAKYLLVGRRDAYGRRDQRLIDADGRWKPVAAPGLNRLALFERVGN